MKTLNHYTQQPASGEPPKQVVVLLHGYGSNGQDLISLAPYWAANLPDAIFVSPDAPFPCEMGFANEKMRQWFSLAEYTQEKLLEGAQQAHPILNQYLDEVLKEYGLKDKDLALVGFSQGTMMSLYTGLRRASSLAGVLGYSGALIGEGELKGQGAKPPLHLIHGESDSVVPVARYHAAVKALKEKGFSISGHSTRGLEHSIDGQGIKSGAEFLTKVFS